jgi:hypothetical protein
MRRFVQFLLLGGLLVIPAVAQRGGGGFYGRGVVGPGFRADGLRRFPYGGFFPGNRFVGFGVPGYWPEDSVGWDSPDNVGGNPDYGYLSYGPAYTNICYGCGYTPSAPATPPKVTDYRGPGLICPQTNGKRLYRIAIPAGEPGRNRYQDNIWVAHDYWYTKGILNFVTQEGEQKQTPVSSIDSAITLQLNRECGLNFQFPK